MSEGMIIRRGGGGGGFDPTGAILKVVTSAGCTVNVSGTSYSRTQTDAEGFPRSGDANVVEHFFNIPSTAFGTITVTATNTYGTNTKTLTVNTAGKVYEALVSAPNIILNSTFGLQSGYTPLSTWWTYSERDKTLTRSGAGLRKIFTSGIPVAPYSKLTVTGVAASQTENTVSLIDQDQITICLLQNYTIISSTKTGDITSEFYPTAELWSSLGTITEIVLS